MITDSNRQRSRRRASPIYPIRAEATIPLPLRTSSRVWIISRPSSHLRQSWNTFHPHPYKSLKALNVLPGAETKPWVAPLWQFCYFPDGGFGAPGTVGAPGATGAPPAEGAAGAPSSGSGALQKRQLTGRKFGGTIFFPHSGQMSGPDVVSGGLKHITSSSFVTIAMH